MRAETALRTVVAASLAGLLALLGGAAPAPAGAAPRPVGDGARVVARHWSAPRELDLTVSSPALGRRAKVRLLTPVGWRAEPGRHWPTLWLLHGCCDSYTSWSTKSDLTRIAALRRVLVVMPEAGRAGFYSDWLGHGSKASAPGWEDYHLRELMPLLDSSFGAGPDRAVAGLSIGGFGALSYAARHPGMFRSAASFSGVADPLYSPGGPANVRTIVARNGGDPADLWGDPVTDRALWAAHDPYELAGALARLPVFLSCGDGTAGAFDHPGATSAFEKLYLAENRRLADRLHALGDRRLRTDFYGAGTHTWPYWQRELHRALPMLLGSLEVPAG